MPTAATEPPLADRIVGTLQESGSQRHRALRESLHVRDEHLTSALHELEAAGRVARTPEGWSIAATP
jgi:DNA-binding HxlR family transcriptional regulator